ncbi:MAG: energy transducer TonB [Bacteroidota bacterium]
MSAPDFDDIVFERLNKEYGAYFLRKKYNLILSLSIILAIIIGNVAVIIPFLRNPGQKNKEINIVRYITMENLMPPDDHGGIQPPPLPSLPPQAKTQSRHIISELKYLAPKVVDSIIPVEKSIESSLDSITEGLDGENIINGAGDGTSTLSGLGTGGGGEGGDGSGSGLYSKVDEMPTFKGGDINKFREWVQKKTKYPEIATVNRIQGKVYITFFVEMDGTVSNVKVARGVDSLIDDEALKSVKSSPKWTPGKHKGKVVRVSYFISVNFEL